MLDNVTTYDSGARTAATDFFGTQSSSLYFPVVERQVGWQSRADVWHKHDEHKALVRVMPHNEPHVLSVVGKNYKLIKNRELFPAIEQVFMNELSAEQRDNVTVRDTMSYFGRECFREYNFKNMRAELGGRTRTSFRVVVWASYGSRSMRIIAGAIDFVCDNGMVVGDYERTAMRHTSGLSVRNAAALVKDMIKAYNVSQVQWNEWHRWKLDDTVLRATFASLADNKIIGPNTANTLMDRIMIEVNERNHFTMWEVYSAFTNIATHSPVRETGNDHAAATRMTRQIGVNTKMKALTNEYRKHEAVLA